MESHQRTIPEARLPYLVQAYQAVSENHDDPLYTNITIHSPQAIQITDLLSGNLSHSLFGKIWNFNHIISLPFEPPWQLDLVNGLHRPFLT